MRRKGRSVADIAEARLFLPELLKCKSKYDRILNVFEKRFHNAKSNNAFCAKAHEQIKFGKAAEK